MKSDNIYNVLEEVQIIQFWCHTCQVQFSSNLRAGIDQIRCPHCSNDFCQRFTHNNKPYKFQPYQKPLKQKKQKPNSINRRITGEIVRMAIQQLASETKVMKVNRVTPQMVEGLKTKMDKEGEDCIICKQTMVIGEQCLQCPCKHMFHQECLAQWLAYKNSCPKCRQTVLLELD